MDEEQGNMTWATPSQLAVEASRGHRTRSSLRSHRLTPWLEASGVCIKLGGPKWGDAKVHHRLCCFCAVVILSAIALPIWWHCCPAAISAQHSVGLPLHLLASHVPPSPSPSHPPPCPSRTPSFSAILPGTSIPISHPHIVCSIDSFPAAAQPEPLTGPPASQ